MRHLYRVQVHRRPLVLREHLVELLGEEGAGQFLAAMVQDATDFQRLRELLQRFVALCPGLCPGSSQLLLDTIQTLKDTDHATSEPQVSAAQERG
jgi:hypothetical protein